jgi:hypothetical protein
MSNSYIHLNIYRTVRLDKKTTVKLRKLNIRQALTASVCMRAWDLTKGTERPDYEALSELITECVIPKKTIFGERYPKIKKSLTDLLIDEIADLNGWKKQSETGKEKDQIDPLWVTYIIAELGARLGYSKDEVLGLYIEEVNELLKAAIDIERKRFYAETDANFISTMYAFNNPGDYEKYAAERDRKTKLKTVDKKEYQKMLDIEAEFLARCGVK